MTLGFCEGKIYWAHDHEYLANRLLYQIFVVRFPSKGAFQTPLTIF